MSHHYFQFPLCALSFGTDFRDRLDCIISFACVDLGKKQWKKFSPDERQLRRSTLPSRHICPFPIDLAKNEHLQVVAGAEHLGIKMGTVEYIIHRYARLWWFIREFEKRYGRDAQVRICKEWLLSEQFPGYPNDPAYIAARTHARTAARSGIDSVINSGVDAIVAPHLTNSTGPAVSGYPNLSLPVGIRGSGRPAGMLMYSTFLHEPQLIGFGFALEQALNARRQPQFLGSIIPIPNGGFCTGPGHHGQPHLPHGKIF